MKRETIGMPWSHFKSHFKALSFHLLASKEAFTPLEGGRRSFIGKEKLHRKVQASQGRGSFTGVAKDESSAEEEKFS
jgi:hypothetical protein